MGRKSLAIERTDQMLDAFEQCIIEYGFEGATLQRTADLAKVNLGMIHHYIGQKSDLLNKMVARLENRIESELAELDQSVPDTQRLPTLLAAFFDSEPDAGDKVVEALYASGYRDSIVQAALDRINRYYTSIWANEISRIHPHLSIERCNEIALAILGLAYGKTLLPVHGMRKNLWQEAAETLIYSHYPVKTGNQSNSRA
jgi:AcrR family transcriptional regulator